MDNVAFSFGVVSVHWYGVIVAFSVSMGLIVSVWRAKLYGQSVVHVMQLFLCSVPIGLIMARLWYVFLNWPIYADNPMEIFFMWHGGLAIHGLLLAIVSTLYFYTDKYKLSFGTWLDIVAPGIAIGQAIGQWGHFFNQENFGYPTNIPWGIYIDFAYRPLGYEQYDFFHPLFLYEFSWVMLVFLIILFVSYLQRRLQRIKAGSVFLLYIFLYSIGKYFIEGFRFDNELIYGIHVVKMVCVTSAVVAAGLFVMMNNRLQRVPIK